MQKDFGCGPSFATKREVAAGCRDFGRCHGVASLSSVLITFRYNYTDISTRFMAADLARQLLSGMFEHAVHHVPDHEIDLAHSDAALRRWGQRS